MLNLYNVNSGTASGKFNRELIAYHIKNLHHLATRANVPGGKLVLVAFGQDPDTGENLRPIIRHFAIGDVDGMTAAALQFEGVPHANVYAPFAVMRPDLQEGQKGTEDDVAATLALVVDADADHGKEPPQSPLPANYEIESSPGNYQQILILRNLWQRRLGARLAINPHLTCATSGACRAA
jgi:hypothetical protein